MTLPRRLRQLTGGVFSARRVACRLRSDWKSLRPLTRHWLINIAFGVAVELFLIALHHWTPAVLAVLENFALDRMTVAHALFDPAPPSGRVPPRQLFVNVDDSTWRSPDWGGGEPYRAPRAPMLELINLAFKHGAQQVVLDILVEGDSAARPLEQQEDRSFAEGLQRLLNNPAFSADKQLVLVRSVRHPLNQLVLDQDNRLESMPYPALSEVRESPFVDEVVKQSAGRIVLAAPYFVYSSDRILRDWQLLKVVCQRQTPPEQGVLRVVPSVQLVVATRAMGVSASQMPRQGDEHCQPFPEQRLDSAPAKATLIAQQNASDEQADAVAIAYWEALRGAVLSATHEKPIDIGEAEFSTEELSNRVVFRSTSNLQLDKYFSEVPAQLLRQGAVDDQRLSALFNDRVVVIGQSYVEAGDQHYTPMGQMPGSVVLLNAIDSMVRYPLIQPLSEWKTLPISLLLIIVVGYVFARWNSAWGPLISTALALPVLAMVSFYLFTYGVWIDFVLPLVGILIHREYKALEERVELRKLARETGGDSHH
jgi:CHASE2 domain-containing sensor protein